ncbi:MAG: hypothetical protein HKL79_03500 [Thermoplasmata archaeon]|nr:hypothetical protein [Thermoplasmata archaeon]
MALAEIRPERIPLPERIDRRMRFGPFPSVRDAFRCVAYAALGALVIPWAGTWTWLPIVGGAFLVTVWHPEGTALDERIAAYVRWRMRTHRTVDAMNGASIRAELGDTVRLASDVRVAVLRCAGSPVAFLPPEELLRRFRGYRDLLRGSEGGIVLASVGTPIDARPWLPPSSEGDRPDGAARAAYSEMVQLLCSRRRRRRVYVLLWEHAVRADGAPQLRDRVEAMRRGLATLGAEPARLRDRSLAAALRHFGWGEARPRSERP